MKEILHYFIKRIIKIFLHVFWIFKIKNNRITLLNELSFTYGDNLKYLNEYIHHHLQNSFEIIFPLKILQQELSIEKKIVAVKPYSIKYFFCLLTSRVIITNCGGVSYLPLRKNQLCISTWHGGGPYKKTGGALFFTKWYQKELELHKKNTKYILSSCRMCSELEAQSMLFFENDCLNFGSPRVDILFRNSKELKRKLYEQYSINPHKKLIVFAPTFRSNVNNFTCSKTLYLSDIDYERVINNCNKKFNEQFVFAVRLHPKLKDIDLNLPNVINLTTYPDMQEILVAADVVITDFSSLMWDFSFTFRPCFLYASDIDQYEKERGFYMPSSKWPFPIARNNDELEQAILKFDETEYVNKVKSHHQECGSYETGKACEQTVNLIKDYINSTN